MRPRVFPAEDVVYTYTLCVWFLGFNEAAGIPRGRRLGLNLSILEAIGFNEAAGIPRGRPDPVMRECRECGASMRPRVFPAED